MEIISRITPSMLEAFQCRLAWYWQYPMGYTPVRVSEALELGTGIHLALERYYGRGTNPVWAFTQWADKVLDSRSLTEGDEVQAAMHMRTLGISMLEGYIRKYEKEPFTVVATEDTLKRKLPHPDGTLTDWDVLCRVDTIVRDTKRERLWVLEHKTFSSFTPGYLVKDHQLVCQVWVAQKAVEEPIVGIIYNGLRKQIATEKVKVALFERHAVFVNKRQIKLFLKRCYDMYQTLTSGRLSIYPEPSGVRCNMCQYKEPCALYVRGDDHQFILDNMYKKREDDE